MPLAHPRPDQASTLSSTALLRVLASEMSEIADDCRSLEVVVGEIFARAPQGHPLVQLQAFDLIIQRIAGVGAVVDALANHAPLSWIDAQEVLGDVSLAALVARLSGEVAGSTAVSAGEAEIW